MFEIWDIRLYKKIKSGSGRTVTSSKVYYGCLKKSPVDRDERFCRWGPLLCRKNGNLDK